MNRPTLLCLACHKPAVFAGAVAICAPCIGAGIYLLICERGLLIANDNDARGIA